MYIAVTTLGKVKVGEPLIMEADGMFDRVAVYEVGGGFVGYVSEIQPSGCVNYIEVLSAVVGRRIICVGAVSFDGLMIMSSDSPALGAEAYRRHEFAGYGVLERVESR